MPLCALSLQIPNTSMSLIVLPYRYIFPSEYPIKYIVFFQMNLLVRERRPFFYDLQLESVFIFSQGLTSSNTYCFGSFSDSHRSCIRCLPVAFRLRRELVPHIICLSERKNSKGNVFKVFVILSSVQPSKKILQHWVTTSNHYRVVFRLDLRCNITLMLHIFRLFKHNVHPSAVEDRLCSSLITLRRITTVSYWVQQHENTSRWIFKCSLCPSNQWVVNSALKKSRGVVFLPEVVASVRNFQKIKTQRSLFC